jgi:hypothetical protein
MVIVSMPSASSVFATSARAMLVFPFARGEPLMSRTFMIYSNYAAKVQQKMHIRNKMARKFIFKGYFMANGLLNCTP